MNIYITSLSGISVFRTSYCPKCEVNLSVPKLMCNKQNYTTALSSFSTQKGTWRIKISVCMKDRYSDILIRNETDCMRRDVHTAKSIIKLLSSGTWASVIRYIYTRVSVLPWRARQQISPNVRHLATEIHVIMRVRSSGILRSVDW
jgi:hypothetical protein